MTCIQFTDAGLGGLETEDLQILSGTISLMTGSEGDGDGGRRGQEDTEDTEEEVNVPDDDGTCELCERDVRRTFHHLIPKETHSKYLKKKTLPGNIKDIATNLGIEPSMSRVWLNTYGTMICGKCHSAVHNAASNDDLAENYNTVELLLEHPKILAFAKYNSKQPVRNSRCHKGPKGHNK